MLKSPNRVAWPHHNLKPIAVSVIVALGAVPSVSAASTALQQGSVLALSALASMKVDVPPCIFTSIYYYVEVYGCDCEDNCMIDDYSEWQVDPMGLPDRSWGFKVYAWGCDKWGDPGTTLSGELVLSGNTFEVTIDENSGGGDLDVEFAVRLDRPHFMGTTLLGAGSHTFEIYETAPTVRTFLRAYRADVVPDGVVNAADIAALFDSWGPCDPVRNPADTNYDGFVDGYDLTEVLSAWGTAG